MPQIYQIRHFLTLFFPLLLTQMAQVGSGVFSSIFSGQAGTVDLAGVAVGVNIWYPVFAGMCGVFFGVSPILSQLRGAGKTGDILGYILQSLYVAVITTAVVLAAGMLCLDPFLGIMGLEPAVYTIAREYLIALAWGILPTFLVATLRYITDAHGKTHVSMAILFFNMAVTVALFRLLVFGGFGIAPMGGVGTGYAITIAAWLTLVVFLVLFSFLEPFRSYGLWHQFTKPDWHTISEQLRIGIPMFVAIFCETSLFSIIGLLMAEFGTVFLAANQAAISYSTLIYVFPWSLSLASTIVIGYEVGARNGRAARQYAHICQGLALIIVCLTASMTYTFITPISALFSSDASTLIHIRHFLLLAVIFSFCDAAGTPVQGILRGYKDVRIITIVAFVTYWLISLPMGYGAAHLLPYGAYGYWYSLIISLAINALALNIRLWKRTAWTL